MGSENVSRWRKKRLIGEDQRRLAARGKSSCIAGDGCHLSELTTLAPVERAIASIIPWSSLLGQAFCLRADGNNARMLAIQEQKSEGPRKGEARRQVSEVGIGETSLLSYTSLKALCPPLNGWQAAR
jgi:hypothetical protein